MKIWQKITRRLTRRSTDPHTPGKADLHVHTDFSDGLSSVMQTLDWVARHTDMDVIAITDHDTLEGSRLAQTLARKYLMPFEVIVGVEVSTADGHLLALFVEEPIPAGLSIEETTAHVAAQGGMSILPHPFSRTGLMMVAERYQKAPERVHDLPLAAVESFNGALLMGPCNSLSPGFAAQLGKPAVAGSDAHVHYAVGSSFTAFPGRTAQALRQALHGGTVRPVGHYWSPQAYFMTGVKWTVLQRHLLPLPRFSLGLPRIR